MLNTQKLADTALSGLDQIGYQLESMGVTDQFNRHNVLAFLFAEQKALEGQLDSLNARVGAAKVRVSRIRNGVEQKVQNGIDLALAPARFAGQTLQQVRAKLL